MVKKEIVLMPFNWTAIELYHRLIYDKKIVCFFDNNELLANRKYAGTWIFQPCFYSNVRIILCTSSDSAQKSIKEKLMSLGYKDADITQMEEEEIHVNLAEVLEQIDLHSIESLLPSRTRTYEFLGRVRKKRLLKVLGAPIQDGDYTAFDGNANGFYRQKSFRDEQGCIHLMPRQITMYVTDKCSLKCKACGAGKQFFHSNEMKDIPLKTIKRDFQKIMDLVDWVDICTVLGGEPFIRRDLGEIMDFICTHPFATKIGRIWLVTNGTIVPEESVLCALQRHHNLEVRISNYREKSTHLSALVDALAAHGISYEVMSLDHWSNVSQLMPDREQQSDAILLERRKRDCVCQCNLVSDGRFYLCDLLNTMDRLRNVPNRKNICVDIYAPDAKEEIASMLDYASPLPPACSWCNGCSEDAWMHHHIPVAEQVAQTIPTNRYGKDEDE